MADCAGVLQEFTPFSPDTFVLHWKYHNTSLKLFGCYKHPPAWIMLSVKKQFPFPVTSISVFKWWFRLCISAFDRHKPLGSGLAAAHTFSVEQHWEHGFPPILQSPKTSGSLGKLVLEMQRAEFAAGEESSALQHPCASCPWEEGHSPLLL